MLNCIKYDKAGIFFIVITWIYIYIQIAYAYIQQCMYAFWSGGNQMVGDLLCVAAGILFAIMNVGSEYLLKGRLSMLDTLGLLSFCGAVVTGVQV